tara:strand:+ start:1038 stop:1655 length:618 start_codon:yes stop_codon:yes gene_type:complete
MQVILLEHVDNLGNLGDEVTVKNGYARNYLIPQGKCLRATNENREVFEKRRAEMEKASKEQEEAAQKIAKKVDGAFALVIRQAGDDGRLYGSVTSKDAAIALAELSKEDINKRQIRIEKPIKYIGVHPVSVKLHAAVTLTAYVNVARTEDEAKEAKELFLNPPKEEKKEEEVVAAASDAEAASDNQSSSEQDESTQEEVSAKEAE